MPNKLKAIAVDDDVNALATLSQMCKESVFIDLVKTYSNPNEFLSHAPQLNFDLCMLDIEMPGMEGITLAQLLKNKPVIFITGSDHKFREALNIAPIDIVPKPVLKDRLFRAFEKAHNLLAQKKEFELFNVAESSKKVKIRLPDILLITTDETDPRHKVAWMKNGDKFTLMNTKLEHLLENTASLIQVNKSEAVSLDAVHEVEHDLITLKDILADNGRAMQVTLSRVYQAKFMERMFYK